MRPHANCRFPHSLDRVFSRYATDHACAVRLGGVSARLDRRGDRLRGRGAGVGADHGSVQRRAALRIEVAASASFIFALIFSRPCDLHHRQIAPTTLIYADLPPTEAAGRFSDRGRARADRTADSVALALFFRVASFARDRRSLEVAATAPVSCFWEALLKFRPLPCEVHHNGPSRIRVWSAHFRSTPRSNEEAPMRPPFYLDGLDPAERTTIKRWQTYVGGF